MRSAPVFHSWLAFEELQQLALLQVAEGFFANRRGGCAASIYPKRMNRHGGPSGGLVPAKVAAA
jgi:hypothetical protein